jgi:hypothetical protein
MASSKKPVLSKKSFLKLAASMLKSIKQSIQDLRKNGGSCG